MSCPTLGIRLEIVKLFIFIDICFTLNRILLLIFVNRPKNSPIGIDSTFSIDLIR